LIEYSVSSKIAEGTMYFLPRDEAKTLEKALRRQIEAQPKPRRVLYYDSGVRDYASAASLIASSIGAFTAATVLFQFAISGDGWGEHERDHEGWRAYRRWRGAAGDARRLYDAPGHNFVAGDAPHLTRVIELALLPGWDAMLAATPRRQLAVLSHDDRMEIYRGFDSRALSEKLVALGYWHDGGARARDVAAAHTAAAKGRANRRAQ
jgi:hypothetical protein